MSPSLTQALMLRKSDQALCAAVRNGHEAAFAAIVMRYRAELLRQSRSLLHDGHAEDAVQQTFVRALQALRSGTEVRELGPWLHTIARNVALTELGARHRRHTELSEEWEDQRHAGEFERRAELRAALGAVDALPDRQRAALLSSLAGEKPSVIAQQLGMSNVALRQLLHRARVTVRAAVNALLPPPLALWLSRRAGTISEKVPRAAAAPAGAAPLATKIAVAVVATATVAAPVTAIHRLLAPHPRSGEHHRLAASRSPRVLSSSSTETVIVAVQPLPIVPVQPSPGPAPLGTHAHRSSHDTDREPLVALRSPAPSAPRAVPAQRSSAPNQEAGVSASSPDSAPVGYGSGSSASGSAEPSAETTAASSGSTSASGPVSTASASGPTMAGG